MEKQLVVRASSLGAIMTKPRAKKDADKPSDTAKKYVEDYVHEELYGIREEVNTPAMRKGVMLEQSAIDLVNRVMFTNYEKADLRGDLGWLVGHPDTVFENKVIDWKCAWTFNTFAKTQEQMDKKVDKMKYDWQIRAYMMLFDLEHGEVCDVLLSTPEELIPRWEDNSIHLINHIPESHRITFSSRIERCAKMEEEIKERYEIANEYYLHYKNQLLNK